MCLQGQLLIASPQMRDPNFFHAVLLMIRHDEEGALGIVLNRFSNHTVGEIWGEALEQPCQQNRDKKIDVGGPCQGTLITMHQKVELSEVEILPCVYCCMQREGLQRVLDRLGEEEFRVFSGYAGWGAEQLEDEMRSGSWLTAAASPEHVFSQDEDLWKTVTQEVGQRVVSAILRGKNMPKDVSLN